MTVSSALLGFAAVAAVLTVIPGLDTTLVLRSALTQSRTHAFLTVAGISTGALLWGAAAAVGAAALLAASEVAYQVVTMAGAAYMAYLGVMLIVKSFRKVRRDFNATTSPSAPGSRWKAFAVGTWTNMLNPKIGAFYVATIPQFIPSGASHLGMGLLLAGVHVVLGVAWLTCIIFGARAARRWLVQTRAMKIIDRVAGTILIGFGARLALERH